MNNINFLNNEKWYKLMFIFVVVHLGLTKSNVIEVINKIKKKQNGQYEDTIVEFCAKDYEMEKNKVLETLSHGVANKYLKIHNKTCYRVIKVPFSLGENCTIVEDDLMTRSL